MTGYTLTIELLQFQASQQYGHMSRLRNQGECIIWSMTKFTRDEILEKVNAGESLKGMDLRGADLLGANMYGADLRAADLRGTNLYMTNLYKADLRKAEYDADTKWPEDFDPIARGCELVEA